uniref:DegT/DnrJ/EryC1/StrS family aminotransferase n=1 Tax=Algoriphagus sp. TaxID=1872435 RepID=UPI0040484C8A
MDATIFIQTCRNEFNFLKNPLDVSSRIASHIQIPNFGYLTPLTSSLIQNNLSIDSIVIHDKNIFLNDDKIIFLIQDNHDNLVGQVEVYFEVSSDNKFTIVFENIGIQKDITEIDITSILNTLIKWTRSVLFPEEIIIIFKNEIDNLIDVVKSIGFVNFRHRSGGHFAMNLGVDRNIGKEMILTAGPSIGSREKVFALDAATNGWNSQWSKYLNEFEKKFAEYVGVKYAIATSSCTGALHISLNALGIGPGDEVIVPEVTWVASANAIRYVGATPIFADIDEKTWNISPESIRKLISKKTKAIIPVHLYGNPCDMDEIMEIARENSLFVVEDAAPSIGAEYKGKKTGSFGDFSAFSFQGAKLAVTGEGGMICTNSDELYKKAYRIWDQGRIPGTFWIDELGVKYKMSNIQAALGLGQLFRNDSMVAAKRRINSWYKERIGNHTDLDFWQEDENSKCIYWMTNIRLNENAKISREEFCNKLKDFKIDTRPVFPAISQYPYWPKKQHPQPIATEVGATGINLPSGVALTKDQVNYICDKIIEILSNQ